MLITGSENRDEKDYERAVYYCGWRGKGSRSGGGTRDPAL